ncbi:MAG: hypothetical protein ACOZDY_07540 [Pseudomonadota bacterium]
MAGHFPFSGRANRVSIYAFFERNGLGMDLQEKYCRWWFDWAKARVAADRDLAAIKGPEFQEFPYGQHAFHDFHLHQYGWSTSLADLGGFIEGTLLPRLTGDELHRLEEEHAAFLTGLRQETAASPRAPGPEVGRYRHM